MPPPCRVCNCMAQTPVGRVSTYLNLPWATDINNTIPVSGTDPESLQRWGVQIRGPQPNPNLLSDLGQCIKNVRILWFPVLSHRGITCHLTPGHQASFHDPRTGTDIPPMIVTEAVPSWFQVQRTPKKLSLNIIVRGYERVRSTRESSLDTGIFPHINGRPDRPTRPTRPDRPDPTLFTLFRSLYLRNPASD